MNSADVELFKLQTSLTGIIYDRLLGTFKKRIWKR